MQPLTTLTAIAAPLEIAKIDTGMIIHTRYNRKYRRPGHADYAEAFLHDLRFDEHDRPLPEFVLNHPAYRGAQILVTASDFGCGSSREGAAYAVLDYGIRVLIGPSFGDIFAANCLQNGVLPVVLPQEAVSGLWKQLRDAPGARITVNLERQSVTDPGGAQYRFEIDPTRKERLLRGLDDVGVTLRHLPEIEAFEARQRSEMTWLAR
ncbi:MAG TPA: 3-isopropylmalate dehydratase small subunit [Burkholderiales bacterium]